MTQAKDIPDDDLIAAVVKHGPYAMTWDLTAELDAPRKVVLAKARKLIKRGLLDGCACGCRGDFTLGPMANPSDYPRSSK
jgi:hypothetical protein